MNKECLTLGLKSPSPFLVFFLFLMGCGCMCAVCMHVHGVSESMQYVVTQN